MAAPILQNLHHRLLPIFSPQTEKFLKTLTPSRLESTAFRYIFSVPGMIQISHLIEDSITDNPGVADFHVCFQYISRVKPQIGRYRRVARNAKQLWLYGATDIELESLTRTNILNIDQTPLMDYWFLVAYGPGLFKTLLAEEVKGETPHDRAYEGFFTFDPSVAYQMLSLLHQAFPQSVPQPTAPEELTD